MHVNAALLHGVSSKRDAQNLSEERRYRLKLGVGAAATLVARAARGAEVGVTDLIVALQLSRSSRTPNCGSAIATFVSDSPIQAGDDPDDGQG